MRAAFLFVSLQVLTFPLAAQNAFNEEAFKKDFRQLLAEQQSAFARIRGKKNHSDYTPTLKLSGATHVYLNEEGSPNSNTRIWTYTTDYEFADSASAVRFRDRLKNLINASLRSAGKGVRFTPSTILHLDEELYIVDSASFQTIPHSGIAIRQVYDVDLDNPYLSDEAKAKLRKKRKFKVELWLNSGDPVGGYFIQPTGNPVDPQLVNLLQQTFLSKDTMLEKIRGTKLKSSEFASTVTLPPFDCRITEIDADDHLMVQFTARRLLKMKEPEARSETEAFLLRLADALSTRFAYLKTSENGFTFFPQPFFPELSGVGTCTITIAAVDGAQGQYLLQWEFLRTKQKPVRQ